MLAHRYTPPRPLPPIDNLPPEVARICFACLEKDPRRRPMPAAVAFLLAACADTQWYVSNLLKRPTPPRPRPALDAATMAANTMVTGQ